MVKKSYFNKYIDTYINSYVRSFRGFNTDKYMVRIGGLANFITANDYDLSLLLHKLQTYGFEVTLSRGQDTMEFKWNVIVKTTPRKNFWKISLDIR